MLLAEFHNALRILGSLDGFDLAEAGVEFADQSAMDAFHRDPFRWLMTAEDADMQRVWGLVAARLPADVLPTPEHAEKAAHFLAILSQARDAGKDWWVDAQLSQIVEHVAKDRKIKALTDAIAKFRHVAVWDDDFTSRSEFDEAAAELDAALALPKDTGPEARLVSASRAA
jgi:hypothetical protein